ncbi:RHS repeat-associated core domain-containing protein [Pseudomonas japonica]|uniref:RHS repeat-associated core domain-containing protein n=1 Tax=Pseudomonas japonica TaxID=256466 RepID=UPI00382ABF94
MLAKGRKAAPITLADLTFLPVMTPKVQRYTPSILYSVCTMAIPKAGPQAVLFACDSQQSVLAARSAEAHDATAYSPYGQRHARSHVAQPGFNGELPEPATGHYLLGNGYRAYNPVLMRFHQPDSWSPFGAGGLNPYAYCAGDPINHRDPTGHFFVGSVLATVFEGMMGRAMQPAQGDSEGSLPWASILLGVVAVVAVGVVGAKTLKPKKARIKRVKQDSRPTVIQRAPGPAPAPAPSSSRESTTPPMSSGASDQAIARPGAVAPAPPNSIDQQLQNAIIARDTKAFLDIAAVKGNGMKARRLLDDHLPLSESRRGHRPMGLWLSDVYTLQYHAQKPSQIRRDPKLLQFVTGIGDFMRKSVLRR